MMNVKGLVALAVLVAVPTMAQAEPWSGDFALGYLATSGNSETSSINAKGSLVYAADRWKNTLTAAAVNTYADNESSAENYTATEQLDYNFTPRDYAFGAVEWNKDLFAAIRERTSETIGYGRHVLMGSTHLLDLEIGAGARQSQTNDVPRQREDDFIGRGAAKYQWNISQTATFLEALKVETGESNTYVESVTQLKLAIVGNLYANLSYTVKNNSETAPDTEHTDTETAVTLSYEFGKKKG
jgi:putative salt-induced outer membrane protein